MEITAAIENAIKNAAIVTENGEKLRTIFSNLQKYAITSPLTVNFEEYKRKDNFPKPEPKFPEQKSLRDLPKIEEYTPRFYFLDHLIMSRKKRKILEANKKYEKKLEFITSENDRIINENEKSNYAFEIAHKEWANEKEIFDAEVNDFNKAIEALAIQCEQGGEEAVEFFCNKIIEELDLGDLLTTWYLNYSKTDNTLVIDYMAPDIKVIPSIKVRKFVASRKEYSDTLIKENEILRIYIDIIYSLPMKIINDIFVSDVYNNILTIVFNIVYTEIDRNTGKEVSVYIYTVKVGKEAFSAITVQNVDPKLFLKNFGGQIIKDFKSMNPVVPLVVAKRDNYEIFDILDESTWHLASDSTFVLNSRTVKKGNEKQDFTEKEFVKAIDDVIRGISNHEDARMKIQRAGREKIIALLINRIDRGDSFAESISKLSRWLISINENIDEKILDSMTFDILNMDTWDYASDSKEMIWNGNKLLNNDNSPHTEEEAVGLMRALFNFLERNGDILPKNKKIKYVKNMLNKMEKTRHDPDYYVRQRIKEMEEEDKKIPDGLFDPRNPQTYQYAKNKPLVIEGVEIYDDVNEEYNGKGQYRKPVTEKSFVDTMKILIKLNRKSKNWEKALELVKSEFLEAGENENNLNDENNAYKDRINKVYNRLLSEPETDDNDDDNDKETAEYIESRIKFEIQRCFPGPERIKTCGGYSFSEAQLTTLVGLSDEKIEKIGEIMKAGENKPRGNVVQNIFNSTGCDGYYVVALRHAKGEEEEKIMYDYFLGFDEFKTEKDVGELLNNSGYLKNHLSLKAELEEKLLDVYYSITYNLETEEEIKEVLEKSGYLKTKPMLKAKLLERFNKMIFEIQKEQGEGKIINIEAFVISDDIKQLLWFGDGPLKNTTAGKTKHDKNVIFLKKQFEPDDPRIAMCEELNLSIDEPSLIYTQKPIMQPQSGAHVPNPYYFPSYKFLSPVQRWKYFKFIENPYDLSFDIGYVFIFYYGLERHLLQGNFDAAFKVILKLRDTHENKSFQKYSGNAVILASLLKNKSEYAAEFMKSLDEDYKYQFSNNLFLMCCYSFNISLLSRDIIRMARTFGFTRMNYIKKEPAIFEECFLVAVKEKTGSENIDMKKYITNADMKELRYEDTPIFINSSIMVNTVSVPMLTENIKLKQEMNMLLESAHEKTKIKLSEMRKDTKKIAATSGESSTADAAKDESTD